MFNDRIDFFPSVIRTSYHGRSVQNSSRSGTEQLQEPELNSERSGKPLRIFKQKVILILQELPANVIKNTHSRDDVFYPLLTFAYLKCNIADSLAKSHSVLRSCEEGKEERDSPFGNLMLTPFFFRARTQCSDSLFNAPIFHPSLSFLS